MDLGLKGKKALVTGASAGLGFAAAKALAGEGAVVIINSRSEERLNKAAGEIEQATGNRPDTLVGDLSTDDGLQKVARKVKALEHLDILVSNTGGPPPGKFLDLDARAWHDAGRLLLESAVRLTNLVLPGMIERKWGRLIYITSIAVLQPIDDLILSNTYRAGVTAFCKTVSNNYASEGITANCVCPGYTGTERLRDLAAKRAETSGKTADQVMADFGATVPAGRVGRPEELAALITFLAGERAGYITGSSIAVDGGANRAIV